MAHDDDHDEDAEGDEDEDGDGRDGGDSPPRGLTRDDVADILGCSTTTVRRLEEAGTLRSRIDAQGRHIFERDQVLAVRESRRAPRTAAAATQSPARAPQGALDGQLAARAFACFERGDDPVEVLMELQIDPTLLKVFHREWRSIRALGRAAEAVADERADGLEAAVEELRETVRWLEGQVALAVGIAAQAAQPPIVSCKCGVGPGVRIAACRTCGVGLLAVPPTTAKWS